MRPAVTFDLVMSAGDPAMTFDPEFAADPGDGADPSPDPGIFSLPPPPRGGGGGFPPMLEPAGFSDTL